MKVFRQIGRMITLTFLAGIVCVLLVRLSPGSNIDERELDLRLSEQSRAAIRVENEARNNLGYALTHYFGGLLKGDLGYSQSRNEPISLLIKENFAVTLRELALGLTASWVAALAMALPLGRSMALKAWNFASIGTTGLLLSVPAALLAYLCMAAGTGMELIFVLALTPRMFRVCRNLFAQAHASDHVAMARAWGVGEFRILTAHVLPSCAPQLFALAATSVAMGVGAAIPIETLCDLPGLGRLAWQAATARDLPLLVNLTMLVALATTGAVAVPEMIPVRSVPTPFGEAAR